jgi:peptidoglycan/LPS O-acetylase OafA/YrhL
MSARQGGLRLDELDALRGIAALSVLLFHYANQFQQTYHHLGRFSFSFEVGKYGVELFFVISGFVIFWTLDRTRRAGDFVVHRFARLYPTYWASLAITAGLVAIAGLPNQRVGSFDLLMNVTMFPDFLSAKAVDGSYWTLQIELFFYAQMLCWYALGVLRRIRWVIAAWLLLAAAYAIAHRLDAPLSYTFQELLIVRYAHCFSVGILMYRMREAGGATLADWLLLAGAHVVSWLTWGPAEAIVLGICTTLFLLMNAGRLGVLSWRPLLFLGGISYTLYLLHQEIGYILIAALEKTGLKPVPSILVTTAMMIVLAWLLSRYVERPANRLLRALYERWRGRAPVADGRSSA